MALAALVVDSHSTAESVEQRTSDSELGKPLPGGGSSWRLLGVLRAVDAWLLPWSCTERGAVIRASGATSLLPDAVRYWASAWTEVSRGETAGLWLCAGSLVPVVGWG